MKKDFGQTSTVEIPSARMFCIIRKLSTEPETDSLLEARERDGYLRMQTFSGWWTTKSDLGLKPSQDFVNTAANQGIHTLSPSSEV